MNFKETVWDEVIEHRDFMTALTTAAIIISPDLPVDDLYQTMLNSTQSIHINDIMSVSEVDRDDQSIEKQISIFLILNAIQKVHSTAINTIFSHSATRDSFSWMSILNTLTVHKTHFQ